MLRRHGADIGVVLISGALGEEILAQCFEQGMAAVSLAYPCRSSQKFIVETDILELVFIALIQSARPIELSEIVNGIDYLNVPVELCGVCY